MALVIEMELGDSNDTTVVKADNLSRYKCTVDYDAREVKETAYVMRSDTVTKIGTYACITDIDLLLESDEDDTDYDTGKNGLKFAKDDIVWEIWYRNAAAKGRVKDEDLTSSPPLVIAQLCVVTSVYKVKGKEDMLGLVAVPTTELVVDTKLSGHKCSVKYVRRFGTRAENRSIVDSQKLRGDFQTVLQQMELVDRFLTNHVGLEAVPGSEVKTFREFLGLDTFERCLYLEGLRRLKKGLRKGIEETKKNDLRLEIEDTMTEDVDNISHDEITLDCEVGDNSYLNNYDETDDTLNDEAKKLVVCLDDNWPLEWARKKNEKDKLKKILTLKKKCWRHEMFMDKNQRNCRSFLPKLVKSSNNSFMDIFGKRKEVIDRDVRIFLLESVFNKTTKKNDFDPRLTKLLTRSKVVSKIPVHILMLFLGFGPRLCGAGPVP